MSSIPEFGCHRCGACCIAPDIAALDKPLGERCPHLTDEFLCSIYDRRPEICRRYRPDELCAALRGMAPAARVRHYLETYGLWDDVASKRKDIIAALDRLDSSSRDSN